MNTKNWKTIDPILLSKKGKIIHQIWFGTIPNKRSAQKAYKTLNVFRDSWKEKNKGWYIIEWDKKMCIEFIQECYPEHNDLFSSYTYEIQRCDAIRYFILHRYGGWYADMDYYCNRSLDEIHNVYKNDVLLVETPNKTFLQEEVHISNSLMYSVPNHNFWKNVIIGLERNCSKKYLLTKHLIVMYTAGPGFLNGLFHSYRELYNIGYLPWKKFHPYGVCDDIRNIKFSSEIYTAHINKGNWAGKDTFIFNVLFSEWQIILFILCLLIPLCIYIKRREK